MRRSGRPEKRPSNWLGRLVTGLVIGLGVGAIALSLLPAGTVTLTTAPAAPGAADLTQPAVPAHASRASDLMRSGSGGAVSSVANPAEQPAPRHIVRDAPPLNALSAVGDARGISTGRPDAQAVSAAPGPFSVVVAVEDESALRNLALAVVGALIQDGVDASLRPLAEAGRPDVILALNGVPGPRNEAWFCDPGPEQSIVLATTLLDAVGPGDGVSSAAGGPSSSFPCAGIHNGRARVPAVLLELAQGGSTAAASTIAGALLDYYATHRGAVLAARAAPRLIWPAYGPVTSHYDTTHPLGIDIGQWEGPIVAASDGVVSFAGGESCCSYGLHVIVESGDGLGTLYAHLSTLLVSEGQRVRRGEPLGEVGCTGTCFGTHLHFEVWLDGARQDPMKYLD